MSGARLAHGIVRLISAVPISGTVVVVLVLTSSSG